MTSAPNPSEASPARTLSASAYHDPEFYERERHAIFARTWQPAAFRAHLQNPGDYETHEFAGWRVFVIVGTDGGLRGFHNVCRHRAGPLVWDGCGTCPSLVCRYHGWAYDLEGHLKQARDFGDVDLDISDLSLHPIAVAEWRGLIFVNLDANATPFEESHAGLMARCADLPMDELEHSHQLVHSVGANWKTYTDNYGEGYHIPLVHPELNREIDAKRYRVEVHDHFTVHSAPARDGAVNAGAWIWQFPNLALNLYPGGMVVERFVPIGPTETRVLYDYCFADRSGAAVAENAEVERVGVAVLAEDRVICEAVQRNLESGTYVDGILSPRHEAGVLAFQTWVRDALETQASESAGSSSNDRELMQ